jgi:predicted DsbA family dithiol-disulfide isomerase
MFMRGFSLIVLSVLLCCSSNAQRKLKPAPIKNALLDTAINPQKMKVDIWSDVVCPFCYIGKRKFEDALSRFEHKDKIEVVWHSYQLDPDTRPQPGKDAYQYLAERKGQSRDWSVQAHKQVTQMAKEVGLEYNFDKAVVANTFDAHRLSHLAKQHGKGDAVEENLFRAYFTEGKDIGDAATLKSIGVSIGLKAEEIDEVLTSDKYAQDVKNDIQAAENLGATGVPFFVLNNMYGVSGAQGPDVFLNALRQAWKEYEKTNPPALKSTIDGAVCKPGGECD